MNHHALLDGDHLLYSCGFSCERHEYEVYCEDQPDMDVLVGTFRYAKEAKTFIADADRPELFKIEKVTIPAPLENYLGTLKKSIKSICEKIDASSYSIYLTGDRTKQYRTKLATIKPYKGNRKGDKPAFFDEAAAYLIKHHKAEVVDEIEADDALSLRQHDYKRPVICTPDKDLDMVPGWHFNYMQDRLYFINEVEGLLSFYEQLLTGDVADNIPGIRGVGIKTAQKILTKAFSFEEATKDLQVAETKWWEAVYAAYQNKTDFTLEHILEIGNLLWIQQPNRKSWTPPGLIPKNQEQN